MPGLTLNAEPAGTVNSYWMSTLVWDQAVGVSKVEMIRQLKELGIDTRPFFYPLSSLPAYAATPSAQVAQRRQRARLSHQPVRSQPAVQLPHHT